MRWEQLAESIEVGAMSREVGGQVERWETKLRSVRKVTVLLLLCRLLILDDSHTEVSLNSCTSAVQSLQSINVKLNCSSVLRQTSARSEVQ